MEARGPSAFEVYCQRCNVSFPIGTRRCVHCGGRTARQRGFVPSSRMAESPLEIAQIEEEEVGESDLVVQRRGIFSPVALMWIVLALAGAFYRACGNA